MKAKFHSDHVVVRVRCLFVFAQQNWFGQLACMCCVSLHMFRVCVYRIDEFLLSLTGTAPAPAPEATATKEEEEVKNLSVLLFIRYFCLMGFLFLISLRVEDNSVFFENYLSFIRLQTRSNFCVCLCLSVCICLY